MGLPTIDSQHIGIFGLDLGGWGFPTWTSSLVQSIAWLRIKQDHEELQGAGRVDVHDTTAIGQNLLIKL